MNLLPVLVLIAWQLATRLSVVAPLYPPNAFHGGNIVAVIQPSKSSDNKVTILHAEPPFVDVVQTALTQWRFPRDQRNQNALVVVNFRDWDTESVWTEYRVTFIPHSEQIDWAKSNGLMPVPKLIIDPLYPDVYPSKVYVVPGGAVILHLEIDSTGTVKNAQILQGILDEFNQAALEAVLKWRFAPAQDESGKAVDSEAYAVCVYRPLATTNPFNLPPY
jgi:TonB family protein